jgi:two-component system response regulator YesN
MVYHFLEHLELTENELDEKRYKYFQSINQATNAEEYEKCVEVILNELLTLSAYKSSDDERMEKLIDYISKNYMYDLKLTDLSEEFNLNYYYLSSYFNQEMKEGFNDYLNRVRIDKACKLLKESRTSIAEVGSQVGYSDHSYFCRVFKKITGRTPSEWKRL